MTINEISESEGGLILLADDGLLLIEALSVAAFGAEEVVIIVEGLLIVVVDLDTAGVGFVTAALGTLGLAETDACLTN